MKSAMIAAESVWDKLQAGDSPTEGVEPDQYEQRIKASSQRYTNCAYVC